MRRRIGSHLPRFDRLRLSVALVLGSLVACSSRSSRLETRPEEPDAAVSQECEAFIAASEQCFRSLRYTEEEIGQRTQAMRAAFLVPDTSPTSGALAEQCASNRRRLAAQCH
jgi:hypothetical protein